MADISIENIYPLTPLQQGILFHSLQSPETGVFIEQIHFELNLKASEVTDFKQHWVDIVERHQILRTAFIWKDINQPVQVVKHSTELQWHELSYCSYKPHQQYELFNELLVKDRATDFDLSRAPLMRHTLIEIEENRHRLLWTFHHLILDGWSVANLLNELRQQLRGRLGLQPKPRPFVDHVNFLITKKQQQQNDRTFWENYLSNFKTTTRLCSQSDTAQSDYQLQQQDIIFTEAEDTALSEFARTQRLSLNTLFHAAWSWTLMSRLQCSDVVYGATFSGRDPALEGVENMIGVFINSLPIRVSQDNRTVYQWLQSLQQNLNQLIDYQHCSLSDIKRYSELPSQQALFESLIVVENYPINADDENSLAVFETITHIEQSNYPCVLLVLPGQPVHLRMIVDGNLISSQQCRQWLEQVHHILTHLSSWINSKTSDVQLLPQTQLSYLAKTDLTSGFVYDRENPITKVIDAQSFTQQPALIDQQGETSYTELKQFSDTIAALLIKHGTQAGDLIAIILPRSRKYIEYMLAVLKSGAAYVIVDPENPQKKIEAIIDQARPRLIISSSELSQSTAFNDYEVINIDSITPVQKSELMTSATLAVIDTPSLAYVLFTSGSTGTPKGVKITHDNLLYSTQVRDVHYPHPPEAFLLLSPFHFDSSVVGIYWTLTQGGKVIVSENRIEQDMQALISLIDQHQVTHTLCLPSLYELILRSAKTSNAADKLQSLKTVIVAGEALSNPELLKLHRELMPQARLYNEYGPTEATVWCCMYDATDHDPSLLVPIGNAIHDTEIIIVDQNNHLVPIGATGELCIAGPGVAGGYLNLEQQTEAQFIELDINIDEHISIRKRVYKTGDLGRLNNQGQIEYLGRLDDQIKIRGQRLELGEIERALLANPDIEAAIALAVEQPNQYSSSSSESSTLPRPSSEADLDQWLFEKFQSMSAEQAQLFINELHILEQHSEPSI